jgi:citrate synthase
MCIPSVAVAASIRRPPRCVNIDHINVNRLMTTAEVARRLGVKRETVYAYVSRGLLARDPASGHRRSLFDRAAVEVLADRARHGYRSGALEVSVRTELTAIDPAGGLFYRGHDAVELARHRNFEDVAVLLWDGDPGAPWVLEQSERALLGAIRSSLPGETRGIDLIPIAVAALGAADPTAADRQPDSVRRTAGRICAGAVAILGGRHRCAGRDR